MLSRLTDRARRMKSWISALYIGLLLLGVLIRVIHRDD